MKKLCLLALAVVMLAGAGCAGNIQTTITPPRDYALDNSRTFNASYDQVWNAAISSVGESFFVLENIEKDSGIMSITFSSNSPDSYIDCGLVTDSGTRFGGRKHTLSFPGAASSVQRVLIVDGQDSPTLREIALSGKINLIFKKLSNSSTDVKVNTRYIVDLKNHVTYYIAAGFGTIRRTETIANQLAFTANETGTMPNGGMQCKSMFTLEQQILDGIQKKLGTL